ncbi:MADF domain-containing protein, partial [Aphis craccivora]
FSSGYEKGIYFVKLNYYCFVFLSVNMAKNINNMAIDCERLIAEIQNRPCIWDLSSEEYRFRDKKTQEWIAVAESINENWTGLIKKKKMTIGLDVYEIANIFNLMLTWIHI